MPQGVDHGKEEGHGFAGAVGCSDEVVILLSVLVSGGFEGFGLDAGGFGFLLYFEGFDDVLMEFEVLPLFGGLDVGLFLFLSFVEGFVIAFHFSK
jgi:hypothetical protein